MPPPRQASAERRHLRLVRPRSAAASGKAVQIALLCILWIAIVWLLFASLVDTSRNDRTNTPPGKTQGTQRSSTP